MFQTSKRSTLRSRISIGFVAASMLGAPVLATPAVAAPATTVAAHELACTKATIAGASKCIAAGQFCKKAAEKDYRKYGYTCNNKDDNGRWHLRKR